ncbi:MAG: valine--tRNA ligase [Thaumarchaeota archaeon]|nr:valine--tRNA ligase [Candidatus Calditenuaceae archaeon]MDW8187153.1 valine--tRNA ligase [Nitrososphaerota archaeon]
MAEKVWDPKLEVESIALNETQRVYESRADKGELFVIDTPPPYPSGKPWHIGAAAHYAQIDMLARAARMMGHNVYFPIGIDRNGIPVERYVERTYGIRLFEVERERFVELCRKALDELESEMLWIMKRLGISGDFKRYYRTDSYEYRALTQATFIELFRKGLIYVATRPNNYCWECGTTLADADLDYKEVETDLVYIRFDLVGGGDVVIATTRPELIGACDALIFNPDDERYTHLYGKKCVVPLYGHEAGITSHPHANKEFGTGVLMVCSYGDQMDVQLFRDLGLKERILIGTDGRMTPNAGPLAGLRVSEARQRVKELLIESDHLIKVERIVHEVPVCERSGTPIEILPMEEFYLKQLHMKDELLRVSRELRFLPERHRQLLEDWIKSLRIDWPISRRRFYATEIPVWYCKGCGEIVVPEPGRYYRPWKEKPPFERCPKCGGSEFTGETRTFDTWMDSSISPLYVSAYMRDDETFKRAYPTAVRPQGKDIVRTWLYYSILRCYQLTGKLPFRIAWIGGTGLDEKGEKMSKSKGNVIDPVPVIEKYGADAFRFWSAQEASHGYDFRISVAKIEANSRFLTKLWNIARYVSKFPVIDSAALKPTDEWIISEFWKNVDISLRGYEEFNFFVPATVLRDFIWNVFASHYIEMTKHRASMAREDPESAKGAWYALHHVLRNSLLLLAPIIPSFTDVIWRRIYAATSIHRELFPARRDPGEMWRYTDEIIAFNSSVWKAKKESGKALKDPISVTVPERLEPFKDDLIRMHNIV